MNKVPSLKVAAMSLSVSLFGCLMAHGQSVENVVFTEESSTVLTETLNGTSIGIWQNIGPYDWIDEISPGGIYSSSYTSIDFSDPLNPGNVFVLIPVSSTLAYSDEPSSVLNLAGSGPGGPLSDYVPYTSGGTEINDADSDAIPVNITVQGVPEPTTISLLAAGLLGAFVIRRRKV